MGKASGAFTMRRQLGGAFGVAILAAAFTSAGVYGTAADFSDGYRAAMAAAAALSPLGSWPCLHSRHASLRVLRQNRRIASYALNQDAVAHAKQLIDAHQYVLRSRWQDVQPRAREQNAFLKTHAFADYAVWHLGLTEGVADETKARYAFVYGDFRRLHRMGLIACHYRPPSGGTRRSSSLRTSSSSTWTGGARGTVDAERYVTSAGTPASPTPADAGRGRVDDEHLSRSCLDDVPDSLGAVPV